MALSFHPLFYPLHPYRPTHQPSVRRVTNIARQHLVLQAFAAE